MLAGLKHDLRNYHCTNNRILSLKKGIQKAHCCCKKVIKGDESGPCILFVSVIKGDLSCSVYNDEAYVCGHLYVVRIENCQNDL